MSLDLQNVSSGYSTGIINDNFQKVEEELNTNVLRRDGLAVGEANHMEVDLDMNSNDVLNVGLLTSSTGSPYVTEETGDLRYVNITGDTMMGSLNMSAYPIVVRLPVSGSEPARKDMLDQERQERISADNALTNGYQAGDANLQAQLTGSTPLEASAFSEISWHGQVVENSVTIPDEKNAWSFGPVMSIALGQSVTIGTDSFWTIANGEMQ